MIKQQALSADEMALYEQIAHAIQPPLKRPLPMVLWADTGAWAFQRARMGSAQVIALNAAYLGYHRAEQAELMYSALMWMYYADDKRIKAPPASRVSNLSRFESWAGEMPPSLMELYATMPACEHCNRTLFTGKPHKSCETLAARRDARIAELERKIARMQQTLAEHQVEETEDGDLAL